MKKNPQRKPVAPPPGLAVAFKMVDMDATATAARNHATKMYPHAARIIEILHTDRDSVDVMVQKELDSAARTMFGNVEELATTPQFAGFTGFHVGFAVCWLLMMAVSGRDGAR